MNLQNFSICRYTYKMGENPRNLQTVRTIRHVRTDRKKVTKLQVLEDIVTRDQSHWGTQVYRKHSYRRSSLLEIKGIWLWYIVEKEHKDPENGYR